MKKLVSFSFKILCTGPAVPIESVRLLIPENKVEYSQNKTHYMQNSCCNVLRNEF